MKIMLLEDDPAVRCFVVGALETAGFLVDACQDLPAAKTLLDTQCYDCLILDRHVPGGDSLELLKSQMEQNFEPPATLFLTALDSVEDKIAGLALADDYLVKPFAVDELLARVKALLRRKITALPILEGAGIRLHRLQRSVDRHGQVIELNPMEFKLLEYLLLHKNNRISRQMLLQHVWEYNFEPSTSIVETYISRLRNKLEIEGQTPAITTIRGAGYIIEDV